MDKKEKGSHAQGDNPVEKQASQLAYDVKYKVKAAMNKGTKMNPAQVAKAYMSQLAKSPAPPAVKAMAKKKLMGEEYTQDIKTLVQGAMVNAMLDVFTEEVEGKKFKIRVTDKKTGNTYIRNADRAKIAELRANPNISSVEITSHGEVSGDGGKKAKKDYDGDGKVESGAKEYRGAVHNAIQKKKGGKADGQDTSSVKEEIIYEKEEKKSKITGKNVDNYGGKESVVKLFPKLGESKALDEFFGPSTVTPKPGQSPTNTKSVKVGKPYPARLNGRPVMKTYDKSGNSSTRPMSAIEKIPLYRKYGAGNIGDIKNSFEPEGKTLDEFLGGKPGDGFIGHPNLGIKAPGAKKQVKKPVLPNSQGGGAINRTGAAMGDTRMQQKQAIDRLLRRNSYEHEGELVEEDCGSCSNCGGKGCAMCAKGKNEGDERELRTKMDLIKNKMRSAGIKVAGETPVARNRKTGGDVAEGMKTARDNVGAGKCWDGYKAKGTKTKNGKEVPNCVKEEEVIDERTRYAKETGKDPQTGKPSVKGGEEPPAAMKHLQKSFRSTGGMMSSRKKPIQPQGKKKEKGKKGYQGPTPVDKIKGKLARKRAPKPDIGSRFD